MTRSKPLTMIDETDGAGPSEKRPVTTNVVSAGASLSCSPSGTSDAMATNHGDAMSQKFMIVDASDTASRTSTSFISAKCTQQMWTRHEAEPMHFSMKLKLWTTNVSVQMMLIDKLGFTKKQHHERLRALPLKIRSQTDAFGKTAWKGVKIMMKKARKGTMHYMTTENCIDEEIEDDECPS